MDRKKKKLFSYAFMTPMHPNTPSPSGGCSLSVGGSSASSRMRGRRNRKNSLENEYIKVNNYKMPVKNILDPSVEGCIYSKGHPKGIEMQKGCTVKVMSQPKRRFVFRCFHVHRSFAPQPNAHSPSGGLSLSVGRGSESSRPARCGVKESQKLV